MMRRFSTSNLDNLGTQFSIPITAELRLVLSRPSAMLNSSRCTEIGRTVHGRVTGFKFAFAEPSVSDRIAFARSEPSIRTGAAALRRKAPYSVHELQQNSFSESGFSAKYAELRAFPPIFRGMQRASSALETSWRGRGIRTFGTVLDR